ncbi:hypothetical protein IGI04_024120 [Brassica rapa subsp. trilocularis]|uniref:Uncharacterized protein n=1 Tax=Brassica rapa subsp. trilocularis TaxID=1813537 RepID=A0ABQ7M5T6_BRACM|nr:hypothetical protein IGI04_024120 [Brassica rapa subsp. trilocularis]
MRVDELEHLEIQVDTPIRQIRSTKENLEQYQILDLFSHCQARSMFDQLFDLKTKLGESDAALNRSLWGDSFSAEHHQQQQ